MSARYDLAVVGSGIIGLGHALAAADRGLSVVVIDRSAEIQGASIRNFGHVGATGQAGEALAYARLTREIWLRLGRDAGVGVRDGGAYVVARHDDELSLLEEFSAHRASDGRPDDAVLLDARETASRLPVDRGSAVGGAHLPQDLQVDPRAAAPAIAAHLAGRGVDFLMRTAVTGVSATGVRTTRGAVEAGHVVVCAGHDVDQLFPELAERLRVRRCGLDMMRVSARLRMPLAGPLLTGWSLVRYDGFRAMPGADRVRARLHAEEPQLAALDLNEMYTQRPDGTLIVGDTHYRGEAIRPFQPEAAFDALTRLVRDAFGLLSEPRVVERWQGVYAQGERSILREELDGVSVVAATSGNGMSVGLGLAESVVAHLTDDPGPITDPDLLVKGAP